MAFSVNDYGKDGPTKDSQDLLDKHIATWAAEQGIEKFTVGKKDVSCELFLNLIVVDEHTCTARATVCWGGDKLPATQEAKKKGGEKAAATAKADAAGDTAAAAKPDATAKDAKPAETKAADAKPADTKAADAKPAEPASGDAKPAAAPTATPVETGALPLSNKPADGTTKAADSTPEKPADKPADSFSVSERDAVAAAAAAAERAAAAAERAAAAAERAAAAVTEQAAAFAAKSQAATSSTSTSSTPAPEPPAFGAASQPVVAPIQPEHPAAKP